MPSTSSLQPAPRADPSPPDGGERESSPLLRIEQVTKIFGRHPARAMQLFDQGCDRAEILERTGQTLGVADVSFNVHKGEFLVVMGLSGSGKSTLVRCLNRLINPTRGHVFIDDEDVTGMDHKTLLDLRRHRMAMVFQRFALLPHRTVLENTAYGLEVMGQPKKKRRDKAREVLELVGLKGWETHMPGALSGGMQQRVGLARALAVDPEIILMDEALSALDPLIRKDMQSELIDIQRKLQTTIVFITHDLDEAIHMGDRIVLMKDGRIVQTGTAEHILTNPASKYVERFVEDVNMSTVLTAASVMGKVRDMARPGDGPRTVLEKMKSAGLSSMFVVDSGGRLEGIVRADHAKAQADTPEDQRELLVDPAVKTVKPDAALQDIVPLMAQDREPVAVVDEDGKLRGVVVVGALLAGLAEGYEPSSEASEAEAHS